MRSAIIPGSGDINPASSPAKDQYYQVYPEVEHIVLDNECVMILNVLGYAPKSYDYPKAIHELSILSSRSQINRDLVAFTINYLTLSPNFMDEYRLDNTGNDNRGFEIHELVGAGGENLPNWNAYENQGTGINYDSINKKIFALVEKYLDPIVHRFGTDLSQLKINDYEAIAFLADTFPENEEIAEIMKVLDRLLSTDQINDLAMIAKNKLYKAVQTRSTLTAQDE